MCNGVVLFIGKLEINPSTNLWILLGPIIDCLLRMPKFLEDIGRFFSFSSCRVPLLLQPSPLYIHVKPLDIWNYHFPKVWLSGHGAITIFRLR